MATRIKTVTVMVCDQCGKEWTNPSYWFKMNNMVKEEFCSKTCGEKYRDLRFSVYEYDPEKFHPPTMGNTD